MCGRFTFLSKLEFIKILFASGDDIPTPEEWEEIVRQHAKAEFFPRFDAILAIRVQPDTNRREAVPLLWSLVPPYTGDPAAFIKKYSTFNATKEKLTEKRSMFYQPFREKRCVIPANGFHEWKQTGGKTKLRYFFGVKDTPVFFFAGLWQCWQKGGEVLETCTIITTEANKTVGEVHTKNRMGAILTPEQCQTWLDHGHYEEEKLLNLLQPYPDEGMTAAEVPGKITLAAIEPYLN